MIKSSIDTKTIDRRKKISQKEIYLVKVSTFHTYNQ